MRNHNRYMKSYARSIARCISGFIAGSVLMGAAHAQSVLINENFNGYTPGTSIGDIPNWSIGGAPRTGEIMVATDVPNMNVPPGMDFGNSLYTYSGGGSATSVSATRTFESSTGHLSLSLDVYMISYTAQITLRSGNDAAAELFFRHSGNVWRVFHADGAEGTEGNKYTDVSNPTPIRGWYRVEMDLYLDSDTPSNGRYDVRVHSLTHDVEVLSLTGLQLRNDVGSVDRLGLVSTFGATSANAWDNISLSHSQIPEPGAYGAMVGLLGLLVWFVRRRNSISQ